LNDGKTASEAAANVKLSSKAVREIGRRYEEGDLDRASYDKQRPGAAELLQRIFAMVCSHPPGGACSLDSEIGGRGSRETQTRALAPGMVGVYELTLQLNSDLPTNLQTQLTIAQDIYVSNIVTVAILNPSAVQ
jgi:hypothetical protein